MDPVRRLYTIGAAHAAADVPPMNEAEIADWLLREAPEAPMRAPYIGAYRDGYKYGLRRARAQALDIDV